MEVKQLREILQNLGDEVIIVLSSDGEGNKYSPLAGVSTQYRYMAESTWNGYLIDPDEEDDYESDYEDDEEDEDTDWRSTIEEYDVDESVPCLVLWPTN